MITLLNLKTNWSNKDKRTQCRKTKSKPG